MERCAVAAELNPVNGCLPVRVGPTREDQREPALCWSLSWDVCSDTGRFDALAGSHVARCLVGLTCPGQQTRSSRANALSPLRIVWGVDVFEQTELHICATCNRLLCEGEGENQVLFVPDPFAAEVHYDYTQHWLCGACALESLMDI